ncbi:MAG: sigma-70 family RNA polymerase sigma factor [Planctomycetota bacterium]
MSTAFTCRSLLHRLKRNIQDQDAWNEFVSRYRAIIFRWCLDRNLGEADAQDVTQEIFIRLIRSIQTFEYDPQKSFSAWLRRITENAIIDFVRSRTRKLYYQTLCISALKNEPVAGDSHSELADQFDLEKLEVAKIRIQKRVTKRRWLSWDLMTQTSMTGKQVAQHLGVSEATVHANKNQVQNLIRSELRLMVEC